MVRDIKMGTLILEQRLWNLFGTPWVLLTHMIAFIAGHGLNQNHFKFFQFRNGLKNIDEYQVIVGYLWCNMVPLVPYRA